MPRSELKGILQSNNADILIRAWLRTCFANIFSLPFCWQPERSAEQFSDVTFRLFWCWPLCCPACESTWKVAGM